MHERVILLNIEDVRRDEEILPFALASLEEDGSLGGIDQGRDATVKVLTIRPIAYSK